MFVVKIPKNFERKVGISLLTKKIKSNAKKTMKDLILKIKQDCCDATTNN